VTLAAAGAYSSLALVVTVVATVVVLSLVAALFVALRAARQLRAAADELTTQARAVIDELQSTVAHAEADLERVDDLIGSAERLTGTVGSASRLAYGAVATPVIKAMAIGAGTARASRQLRRRNDRTSSSDRTPRARRR
jgi:predicted PurR-regulated permease PerM